MKRASVKWITSFCLAVGLALFVRNSADAVEIPQRVVSINVCTDQLALLLAGEGQLQSVSYLSQDPELSVMAAKAQKVTVNHAQAEEVFLMKPDLVLAGTFSSRATVGLLRRLGVRVEEFAPARSFGDIEAHLRRMGELLGRQAEASSEVDKMKAALAVIRPQPSARRSRFITPTVTHPVGERWSMRLCGLQGLIIWPIGWASVVLLRCPWKSCCSKSRIFWCAVQEIVHLRWLSRILNIQRCGRLKNRRGQ